MKFWFRLYSEVVDDPKVQALPAEVFKAWINLLCLTSQHDGTLPPVADIAFRLRVSQTKAVSMLEKLRSAGLLDGDTPHNWEGRQFIGDGSTARVHRYRNKRRELGLPVLSDYGKFRPLLIARDGELCVYCRATENLVVDHMVPIELGGTDNIDNLALACKGCNSGKAGRTPELANMPVTVTTAVTALQRFRDKRDTVTVTSGDTVTVTPQKEKVSPTPPSKRKTESDSDSDTDSAVTTATDAAYPSDFEAFWAQYPNKTGKGAALKVWKKLKPSKRLQEIIAAALAVVKGSRQWKRDNGQFIPHAATWLNQSRWDDDPDAVVSETVQRQGESDLSKRIRESLQPPVDEEITA